MSKFYVGQRVRINCPNSICHGWETRVMSDLIPMYDDDDGHYMGHDVDILLGPEDEPEYPGQLAGYEPRELVPIDDPSDDSRAVTD